MASYPSAVVTLRTVENKNGVVYDAEKTTVLYAEDENLPNAEIVAIETELGTNPKGAKADVKTRLNDVDSAITGKQDSLGFTPENIANKKTTLADNSDTYYPTQKAVKTANDLKQNITLDASPDADHSADGPKTSLVAGIALVAGEVCYMGADGKMEKGDADAVANAFCFAMALATIAENDAGVFALPGCFVRDDSWNWGTLGQPVYLDTATAGGMTQTAPSGTDDVIQIIGIAITADIIFFNPQLIQVEHV